MKTFKAFTIFATLLASSCGMTGEKSSIVSSSNSAAEFSITASYNSEIQTDIAIPNRVLNKKVPLSWESEKSIEGVYTRLELDENSYLLYKPLNGSVSRIKVEGTHLTIYWWLDGPSEFEIKDFNLSKDKKSILFSGINLDGNSASFAVNLKGADQELVNWQFIIHNPLTQGGDTRYNWTTTIEDCESHFRTIDQKATAHGGKERSFRSSPFE